jgi:molybdopterin/thiamine biosynthesis adenylyltransferase
VADPRLVSVHDALTQRGFNRDWQLPERFVFSGVLGTGALDIPVDIEVTDLDFVTYPPIRLHASWKAPARKLPHIIGPNYLVCYYACGAVVLDRYNPGGTVLQCLDQAEGVLRDAIRGRSDGDFADEFQAYWGTVTAYIDLPDGYEGPATVKYITLVEDGKPVPVVATDESWLVERDRRRHVDKSDGEQVEVIRIDRPLSVDPALPWPPTSLLALNKWLEIAAPEALGRVERLFTTGSGTLRAVVLTADNGHFYYRATLPPRFRTKELLNNRRVALPRILAQAAKDVEIEQAGGILSDRAHVFSRNLGGAYDLSDARIALIGCGTIGGFLAQQLAQCGCGSGNGSLTLYDSEKLSPANLGRHVLGVPFIDRNKAVGVAEFLKTQLPPLDVTARNRGFTWDDLTRGNYDLVIDATGEEAFSIALNAHAVQGRPDTPPVLFVWLAGNGAAARAILTGSPDHACFKCLKTDLAGGERFPTLKAGVEVALLNVRGCGDTAFAPFPVTRPVTAAAMACDMVLDWSNGGAFHHFRARVFDERLARLTKSGSPGPLGQCPACGARHP